MPDILDEALENYRRQKFLAAAAATYEAIAEDPKAAVDYRRELTSLEGTLADGIETDL